ncbi:MAG: hypothetical protein WAT26_16240 [Saprospiraceae bacterium]
MKAKYYFRLSAILVLIHLLGHTMGHLGWDKPEDPKMKDVVDTMKNNSSEFMGATHSMADYFNGYSIILIGLLAMSIVLFWILSNHTETNQKLVNLIALILGLGFIFFGTVEYIFFFPFAAIISLIAGISALIPYFTPSK